MIFKTYRRLFPLARPYRGKLILSSVFNIFSNFVGSVNLLALLPIVSIVIGESHSMPTGNGTAAHILVQFSRYFLVVKGGGEIDATASLIRICFFVFSTSLLKNLFGYLSGYIMAIVENGMGRALRDNVFEKLSTLSLDYYYDRKSGHLLSRLTNDVSVVNGAFTQSISTLIGQPVQMIVILATMVIASVKMTFVSLAIGALSIFLIRFFGKIIKQMSHRLQQLQGDILSVAQEMISG